jgi:hypothetical protein
MLTTCVAPPSTDGAPSPSYQPSPLAPWLKVARILPFPPPLPLPELRFPGWP